MSETHKICGDAAQFLFPDCQPVSGFKNSSGDMVYDIVKYLNMMYNETILFDR